MRRNATALATSPAPSNGATLVSVARAAGVSLATASRVFSNPELVRQDTAERVLQAAGELGFRPNLLGAKLRAQRSRIVGVMLPTLENAVFAECWRGIEEAALAQGYSLMLVTSRYDPARERERIEYLLRHRVDGMVLTVADAARSAVLEQLDAEGVPYVLAYNQGARRGKRYSVSVDNRVSARAGVETLIAAGHRRISVVSGAFVASDRARQRHMGYQDAMRAHGLQPLPPLSLPAHTPTHTPAEVERIRQFVTAPSAPTALFCTNDMLAIGVISILKRLGLSVPGDVSVLGYDGIELGQLLEPPLSTVAQPNNEIGARALGCLLARLEPASAGAAPDPRLPRATLLPHALRAGATVGPPA
ncbi:putative TRANSCRIPTIONal REGULATOR, LacI family [Cupriavidus taiwanensis]|uniref:TRANSCRIPTIONal REGULATOR, LacI family n=1 Tax=Cupriavidus taiwanensis TaxID=164546 RepID=A0A375DYA9_9BURK|nr:substrate-binding domain-containing protein [Cupriavidus taiwanensis]SOZ16152.1 putative TRANSCRIPTIONal REGULATOR, LacI family [Cupriavidus taiwanensis]SOZ29260.1 putative TRANSCRIPTIONal REGULATOR, LacI family [Cupriavidus taiwanensis]SOZ46729.1 putative TRANSCRIPTIONal REGULATOR, LacI family [Cupriavidus taiwanensis]SOZ50759.1 putative TRANSCRIPTIONal REGULATOR, LacI family [Cupriavidus taiwanensis]SOZ52266.1 putative TRANSCRIPTIONal REGULATOR, LacI family [Cupriavidus taiwanensis]